MKSASKLLLIVFFASLAISPAKSKAAGYSSANAKTYLSAHADNPWSTMALSALGAASIPTDHLKSVSSSNAIDYAAPVLAITALGENPRTFPQTDYVAKLKSFYTGGQIGDSGTLNDDIFGMLALISAGETSQSTEVSGTEQFILSHQGSDGGWGFAVSGGSDSNTTSAGIAALASAGVPPSDSHIQNALNYLKTAQNSDGGFTYDPASSFGRASDSSSTAWALWALSSLGVSQSSWAKDGHSPVDYLSGQQSDAGWFKYQDNTSADAFSGVTTAYAVIALEGKTLPLRVVANSGSGGGGSAGPQKFDFRIEGANETVCAGQAEGPTALDIVKNAASTCNFTYHIKDTSFGPYLDKINNDEAAGVVGWLYRVNYNSPDVGAQDYQLAAGDSVLWYFTDYTWLPTRLSVSSNQISSGQAIAATVEFYEDSSWKALSSSTVYAGTSTQPTDSSGHASLSPPDGYYKVFASKQGFIRSNGVFVNVGQVSSDGKVSLSLNVKSGSVLGDTIAFTVTPGNIDFGALAPGQSSEKNVTIANTGTGGISLEAVTDGDQLFKDNLKINNTKWQDFETSVPKDGTKNTPIYMIVPGNYSGSTGNKTAQITFWASPQ